MRDMHTLPAEGRTGLARFVPERLSDRLALAALGAIGLAIAVNALVRQPVRHPAPMFQARVETPVTAPLPVARPPDVQSTASISPRPGTAAVTPAQAQPAARARREIVSDIQRELARRGLYDGTVDGASGPRTEAGIRRFEREAGLNPTGEPTEALLARLRERPAQAAPQPAGQRAATAASPAAQTSVVPAAGQRPVAAPAARPEPPQSISALLAADQTPPPRPAPAPAPRPNQQTQANAR